MQRHLTNFLIVSTAYIVAFSLTLGFVFPLQTQLLSNVPLSISLLFLPHGVRILTMYFYGWLGIIYLLPASYLMLYLSNASGINIDLAAPVISLASCYFGYLVGTLVINDKNTAFSKEKWKFFLCVGLTSSIANAIGQSVLHNQTEIATSTVGYIIGDMAGLMLAFYVLIMGFRWSRLLHRAND